MTTHPVLAEALKLHEAGFAAILQRGKRAFQARWNTERQSSEQLREAFRPGYNVAIVTGRLSAPSGKALIVVDCDVREASAKTEAWKALRAIIGDAMPTTRTGGDGAHWWYLMPAEALPAKDKLILAEGPQIAGSTKRAWTVEVLLNGHACTVPPSVHPSGKPYEWANGGAHVADAPEGLLKAIAAANDDVSPDVLKADGWPMPLPLLSDDEAAPYPLDTLPGGIGAAVREVVGFVQCPPALAACSALTALSTVTQGLVSVRRSERLESPASLYFLAVAESGERKSTVDEHFTRPLREWELQKAEALKLALAENNAAMRAWEARREGLLNKIRAAAQKGEQTQGAEDDLKELEKSKPTEVRIPRLVYGDITSEKLGECLALGWPSGAVISAEAGIVFGGHALQRDSQMRSLGLLNSLWSGETFQSDRRTKDSYAIRCARLSMGLAAQPDTVRQFFAATKGLARGSGFAARFLIAWPTSTQGTRLFREPPEHWPHLSAFHRRIGALLDIPLAFDEHNILKPVTLDLSPEACAAWIGFHDEVEHELRPGGDMAEAKDVASKSADNAARLAAIFHVYEHGPSGQIGATAMQAACTLAAWHLYEARRFLRELALPAHLLHAVKLDEWLIRCATDKGAASLLRSEVQRRGPAALRDGAALDKAIATLADANRAGLRLNGREKWLDINPQLLGGAHGVA